MMPSLERERDHHRLLTADVVRDPAEQRPRHAVDHGVQHQRQGQRRHRDEVQVDLEVLHAQVLGDHAQLSNGHHAAGDHAGEHHEHQPEQRCAKRFLERVIAPVLHDLRRIRDHPGPRRAQEPGEEKITAPWIRPNVKNAAWNPAVAIISAIGMTVGSAGPVTARRQADCQAALIWKPLQRVVDAGRVDGADADAADGRADVEPWQRRRLRVDDPGQAGQHAAKEHQPRGP